MCIIPDISWYSWVTYMHDSWYFLIFLGSLWAFSLKFFGSLSLLCIFLGISWYYCVAYVHISWYFLIFSSFLCPDFLIFLSSWCAYYLVFPENLESLMCIFLICLFPGISWYSRVPYVHISWYFLIFLGSLCAYFLIVSIYLTIFVCWYLVRVRAEMRNIHVLFIHIHYAYPLVVYPNIDFSLLYLQSINESITLQSPRNTYENSQPSFVSNNNCCIRHH